MKQPNHYETIDYYYGHDADSHNGVGTAVRAIGK